MHDRAPQVREALFVRTDMTGSSVGNSRSSALPTISSSAAVTAATIAGQAPGFAFPIVVAALFGATHRTDAFFIAFAAASFVLNAMSGATQHAIVPYLVQLDDRRAARFAASALTFTVAATTAAIAALFGLAIPFADRVGGQGVAVVIWLAALVPFMLVSSAANLWVGVLNARRRYVVAALSPAARWLPLLALIGILGPDVGFRIVPAAYLAGESLRAYLLYRWMRGSFGREFTFIAAPSPDLAPFLRTGTAQIAGSAIIALLPLVDRVMASWLTSGSVTLLDYAERIWQAPVGLMMSGFLVVSLAHWSAEGGAPAAIDTLRRRTFRSAAVLFALSILPIAVLIVIRHAAVEFLFGHSGLSAGDLARLGDTLGAYIVGVPVYLAGLTYARAYLVLRRSDWLLVVSVVQLGLKLVLNVVLMRRFGLPGIALATSGIYALGSLILVWALHSGLVADRTPAASRA